MIEAAPSIQALVFDVFGTVVDWRSSIAAEGAALGQAHGIACDWVAFADAWRAGYRPAIERIRRGELAWRNVDRIHRERLDEILEEFAITGLEEAEIERFNRAWHRLAPWPDTLDGLARLKQRFVISTLSNGSLACLVNMAKHAGLPWDCVISADILGHYKPDPETYRGAARLLGLCPDQVMLVAAHNGDLAHAAAEGLGTAFVLRPREYGPRQTSDREAEGDWDYLAADLVDLARQMGL